MAYRRPAPIRALPICLLALAALLIAGILAPHAARAAGGDLPYRQGQAAAKAGQYATAAHDYEQAILQGHNDPDTFYQLGLAYNKLKRWNDATWAIATALGDSTFYDSTPDARKALDQASAAGGSNVGPPPSLSKATMSPMQISPQQVAAAAQQTAMAESRAAYSALQGGAFFLAPEFNNKQSVGATGVLSQAAADLQNNSNTMAKFALLGAVPPPYTSPSAYAKDLFTNLNLQQAVLVVVTPKAAAAYSDRLDSATVQRLVDAQRSANKNDSVATAAAIARAVVRQADDNDNAATHRNVAIAAAVIALILTLVAAGIWRIARPQTGSSRNPVRRAGGAVRPRTR